MFPPGAVDGELSDGVQGPSAVSTCRPWITVPSATMQSESATFLVPRDR